MPDRDYRYGYCDECGRAHAFPRDAVDYHDSEGGGRGWQGLVADLAVILLVIAAVLLYLVSRS